ncbi:hypothetical protein ABFX02_08G044100 [Erythranthe guttata]
MPPAPLHKASSVATHLINKCAATTSLREARQLHALLLTTPPTPTESPLFINNNLLSMYGRCGSLADSQHLFDTMPQRSVVSYNALISAYSRNPRHAHLAFLLYDQLENDSLVPNGSTITSLLHASAGLGNLWVGSSLHARCVKAGLSDNVRVQTSLLGMYSSCGDVVCAKNVFGHMMDKDDIAWNSIISAYVKNGRALESLEIFRSMLRNGANPTQFTYSLALTACAKSEDYDSGKLIHAQVLLSGTPIDLPLQNSLLDMYCSCNDTHTAYNVFLRIKNPDLISWNSMIGGFSENGDANKAMCMFIQLMRISYLQPDEYTLAAVISGTCEFPARSYGKPLHARTEKTSLGGNSMHIRSSLISMYFINNDPLSSQKIFGSFPNNDAVLWTDMIAGHVRIGDSENALNFFHEMSKQCVNLDSFALSSALSACADLVTLRQGEMIHCLAVKTGNENEVCVHSSLVDMYAKNGELESATCTFSRLPKHDLMCWNSMLTGYSHHGKADEAFRIFFKMLKHGFKPDPVTILSLLSVCNHCGLVEKGRFFWSYMVENCLRRGPRHYSCMISMLSRGGLWEEAEEMIMESPFVDDYLEYWRTVLSSCIKNGDLGVGIRAADRISRAGVEDSAANVLLSKIYAATGRWGDVLETRRKMKKLTVEKEAGLSWVEVRNNFHVFSSSDGLCMQNGEMRAELDKLLGNLMPVAVEEIVGV